MPHFRYTAIFNYQSGITPTDRAPTRTAGWSESYYAAAYTAPVKTLFVELCSARLAMCPLGTSITRGRIQQVDPAGPGQLSKLGIAAPATYQSDVPQMTLKIPFLIPGGGGQILREFRGVPDEQVVNGEFTPVRGYTVVVVAFLNRLANGTWLIRRRGRTPLFFEVDSISAGGAVVMRQAWADFAVGAQVQVYRTFDATSCRKFGYLARVVSGTDMAFTISGPKVRASRFGKVRLATVDYVPYPVGIYAEAQSVVRKVGRPFRDYSGRVSRRP